MIKQLITIFSFLAFTVFAQYNVNLSWTPSTSSNVFGYKIYSGGESLSYTNHIDVGNVTSVIISNLTAPVSYFGATAYDSNHYESPFSNEAIYNSTNALVNTNTLVDTNYYVYVGAMIGYGTNVGNLASYQKMMMIFTNPPAGQAYNISLIITNQPF